jgi:MTH538 TIR-like domain (DUF1863)
MVWDPECKMSFKYAAFVSYRHAPEDRRWAEWLFETLASFETPEELVRLGARSCIGKLFRDDNEMPAKADLAGYIKEALWEAENLIVVCSSATPTSDWVRAEIALFKHWGRAGRIYALLIEPEARLAFPAELRHWRIAGEGPNTATWRWRSPLPLVLRPLRGRARPS